MLNVHYLIQCSVIWPQFVVWAIVFVFSIGTIFRKCIYLLFELSSIPFRYSNRLIEKRRQQISILS